MKYLKYISPQMKQIVFHDAFFQHFQQPRMLSDTLNIQMLYIDDNYVVMALPINGNVHQPAGLLHGGVSVALSEEVCSFGSCLFYRAKFGISVPVVGVEINANHLVSSRGGFLLAVGQPIHTGRKLCVWQCDLYNVSQKAQSFDEIPLSLIEQLIHKSSSLSSDDVTKVGENSSNKQTTSVVERFEDATKVSTSRCTTAAVNVTKNKKPMLTSKL